jgi:tetratricopeptide (TPR) repeat protein
MREVVSLGAFKDSANLFLLARSSFELRRFEDAAGHFENLAADNRMLADAVLIQEAEARSRWAESAEHPSEEQLEDQVRWKNRPERYEDFPLWELNFLGALCWRQAGRVDDAVATMKKFAETNRELGLYWWCAKWYSEEGKYTEAAECLGREYEASSHVAGQFWDSDPIDNWAISGVKGIGEVLRENSDLSKLSATFRERNPQLYETVAKMLQDYWPQIEYLQTESRDHWIAAEAKLKCPPSYAEMRPYDLTQSAQLFAKVTEMELRERVFVRFRSFLGESPERMSTARKELDGDKKNPFLQFLIREKPITFGQMTWVMEDASSSSSGTGKLFGEWIRIEGVGKAVPFLGQINRSRNPLTHTYTKASEQEVLQIARLCREALSFIVRKSTGKQG